MSGIISIEKIDGSGSFEAYVAHPEARHAPQLS